MTMQEQDIIQYILQRNSARCDNHPQPDTALADSLFHLPDTLGPSADDLLWTLSFEILEVYPGSRFSDTAITELLFGGMVTH